MTIKKIILNGQNECNMGEATADDAAGYREWIAAELAREYPGVEIEINEEDATRAVELRGDYTQQEEDSVNAFAERCWETCPWSWVK